MNHFTRHRAGIVLSLFLLLWVTGCARPAALSATKKKWTSAGWTYVETFGKVRSDAVEVSHATSAAGTPVRAHWNDNSVDGDKSLSEAGTEFLVVKMSTPMAHTYSVVFKRKSP
ncbi:MAG: hypothetical protein EOP85_05770 [Verrucomicrobiaceae bacterium]|nr:MAG: hypothetical protein EOP85_05770 [Verrucomicrobiaceae bacterium]